MTESAELEQYLSGLEQRYDKKGFTLCRELAIANKWRNDIIKDLEQEIKELKQLLKAQPND